MQIRKEHGNLRYRTICNNDSLNAPNVLEYLGRIKSENGYMIFVSGSFVSENSQIGNDDSDKTLMLQIDKNSKCTISQEWNTRISSSNSIASLGDFVYFGQNKMVTRLDLATGEYAYFTCKSNEEIAALGEM